MPVDGQAWSTDPFVLRAAEGRLLQHPGVVAVGAPGLVFETWETTFQESKTSTLYFLINASRSALISFLSVEHIPCGAPG